MKPTEKLYDRSAYATVFESEVLSCDAATDGYRIVLSSTLFFPEEGGQSCDTGTLDGIPVKNVQISQDGIITHILPSPIDIGKTVRGEIEFPPRFRKMQHHTGEHLLCGIAHKLYGAENIGFHLGDSDVTMDLDIVLTPDDLDRIELLANEAIYRNVPVTTRYPDPEELKTMTYRAKLDLSENVRIVTIDGYDTCACCAPHVAHTGEIGLIRVVDAMHYKGGIRLRILCGNDAFLDYRTRYRQVLTISNLLSAKQNEVVGAVEQLQHALIEEKRAENTLRNRILEEEIKTLPAIFTEGNLVRFAPLLEARQLREFTNEGVRRCSGIFAVFSGDDEKGYSYVMGSRSVDLREAAKEINTALSGRGGGTPEMIQGSVKASECAIHAYFASHTDEDKKN